MGDAFDRVWQLSEQLQITPRRAALVAAIREVSGALTARGIYP
jgi:glutamate dehydrogenase/leucine dehydrogenase